MRASLPRVLLPLLLLAQVGLGMSPGRVLCIAASCCDGESPRQVAHHEHHHHGDGSDHHHGHGHEGHGPDGHGPDGHGARLLAAGDACDCHFHIAMPDDVGGSRERQAERLLDMRLLQRALDAHASQAVADGAARAIEAPPPWTFAASDQCRARESMRLLI
jgi:hypothetical protein